jgi:hypothetical protein
MSGRTDNLLKAARGRVAGPNRGSWAARRRELRLRWLADTFPDLAEMSVIDLGGRLRTWKHARVRPKRVHVVNLEAAPEDLPEWAEFDNGDACDLPAHIARRRYDLVFSNSVIEHVGGHERRLRFAESVHLLSEAHWVQTPYRYFPIEPHWLAPGMQFLPLTARATVAQHWPVAIWRARSRQEALRRILGVELLDRTQMRYYFPGSALRAEKILGIPKSLIAYRAYRDGLVP